MPRYYNFKKHFTKYRKYYFILDWFVKSIMKQGKKSVAIRQVRKCFNLIKRLSKRNTFEVFLKALYMTGPRIGYHALSTPEHTIEYMEYELSFTESAKHAMEIIKHNSQKRREKKFHQRLALEIIDSFNGNSLSIKEKENIENDIIKKITEHADLQLEKNNYE